MDNKNNKRNVCYLNHVYLDLDRFIFYLIRIGRVMLHFKI